MMRISLALATGLCAASLMSAPAAAQRCAAPCSLERQQEIMRDRHDQRVNDNVWADKVNRQHTDNQRQINADAAARLAEIGENYNRNVALITQRHADGLARIKAGKATTGFAPVPNFSVGTYFRQRYPQAAPALLQAAPAASAQFHQELRARGLSDHDLADGEALAFVTAYEVYSGQKTGPAHLAFARNAARTALLTQTMRQAAPDAERQSDFENFGVLAFGARLAAARGDPSARAVAASVLTNLGEAPAGSIMATATGFANRGSQIIAAGRATTIFTPGDVSASHRVNTISVNGPAGTASFNQSLLADIRTFYGEVARRGGRANDLADLVTYLMVGNATAITGQEPNAAQVQSVRAFARAAILKSEAIQAAPDASKQTAVEEMMISTVDALSTRNAANAQRNLAQIFQALGEDLNAYQLTETGIVRVAQAKR